MLRTVCAILIGKSIFFLSRALKLGGGYAAPGLYALKIHPNLVGILSSTISKQIIITGTNGKTTTAGMLVHLFRSSGEKVIRNQTGSNLERGIASTLIKHSSVFGHVKETIAIWEIDEAAFNAIAPKLKPDLVVFLNVFRDQLDRYGEVDSVVSKWLETIKKMPNNIKYLVNADDGSLEKLLKAGKSVETYSVKGVIIPGEKPPSKKLNSRFSGAEVNNSSLGGINFRFHLDKCDIPVSLSVPGNYNVYNAVAALSARFLLGGLADSEAAGLKNFKSSFGRFEKFSIGQTEGYIFLIKNPVGATQVLQTVTPHINTNGTMLFILNDNFADGKDVSWIWDAEFERVKGEGGRGKTFVSGTRAFDMALRLKYAGLTANQISTNKNISTALNHAIKDISSDEILYILPTYTVLLELQRKGLCKRV